jgi:L-ascorbate metabolism protein UlaG (beta-lactamase superfamily)
MHQTTLHSLGGPTVLIEYAGLRLLTDPTFDEPRSYERAPGVFVHKLSSPVASPDELDHIDAVLLSHDHHKDNLDEAGRAFLTGRRVLTTTDGAARLGDGALGLREWETTELGRVTVTAVPAQHGPHGTAELTAPVIGFVLTAPDAPTLYVSGDNSSVDVVAEIAERLGPIDVALLFLGAASLPIYEGFLTLTAEDAVRVAALLPESAIVPAHYDGWGHYTQGLDDVVAAFDAAGVRERLTVVPAGSSAELP